jgi:flagellar protein FlaG
MASEAISSSIMIIGAVLGAAVLITAILPAIFSAGDTFGTVSSSAEQKLRTDFRIVNTYAAEDQVFVWMKNVGTVRVSIYDLQKSDVFLGIGSSNYKRYGWGTGADGTTFKYSGDIGGFWGIGDTIGNRNWWAHSYVR